MSSKICITEFASLFERHFKHNNNSRSLAVSSVHIDDIEKVVNFYDAAFRSNRWFGTQLGSKSLHRFFEEALIAPDMTWLKLSINGSVVGFSALIEDGDFIYSDETLISDAFQGRGIATIYFRALCHVARQHQKPIYGDIIYSRHSRVIARVFASEFGLVPIGFVLTRTKQSSPLVMVRIATQRTLQNLSTYEKLRLIADAAFKKNDELGDSQRKCVGFNYDTNTHLFLDDQELIRHLLDQNDQTEIGSIACLLELIKIQLPLPE